MGLDLWNDWWFINLSMICPVSSSIDFKWWILGVLKVSTYGLIDDPSTDQRSLLSVCRSYLDTRFWGSWPMDEEICRRLIHDPSYGSFFRMVFFLVSREGCRYEPRTTSMGRGTPYGPWLAIIGFTYNFWKFALRMFSDMGCYNMTDLTLSPFLNSFNDVNSNYLELFYTPNIFPFYWLPYRYYPFTNNP